MTPRVLIVDDSLTVQMDLRDAFREAGFDTVVAGTAAEARHLVSTSHIDLVVLDVVLPDTDGIDLLAELKSTPRMSGVPVVMLSSERQVRDRVAGLARGADEYVGKPYKRDFVIRRARDLLGESAPTPLRSTVLVIDDSLTFCEALREELEPAGFRVVVCASGEEGLRKAGDLRPDAVVVDGILPGIDGATVVRRLRLDPGVQRAVCLFLTGSDRKEEEIVALDAGADGFVHKAKGTDAIVARLTGLLRAAESSRRLRQGRTGGTRRILMVGVSESVDQWISPLLEVEGHELIKAPTQDEAVALLALQAPDCVLIEETEQATAAAVCRRLRTLPLLRGVPLVVLSVHDPGERLSELLDAGADDCIASEATSPGLIHARLRALLRRHDTEVQERATQEELASRARNLRVANKELRLRRDLIERMPLGAMVLEWEDRANPSAFRIVQLNPAMVSLLQIEADELVGRTLETVLPELATMKLLRKLARAVLTGRSEYLEGLTWGESRQRVWSVQAVPLVDDMVGVIAEDITDITEAKKERDRMEARMHDLQRLEAIGRLAGGVAHDFNNILTVIDAYANLVREQLPEGSSARDDIETVLEASRRAASVTSQLLAFGRRQVQKLQPLDLNRIIADIDRMLQRLIGEDIELATILAPDLGTVKADPTHVEQVVMNLAINARDAMPRGGKLTISTRNVTFRDNDDEVSASTIPSGRYALLAVSDTGIGMDKATQARIFEPFFTSKEPGKGTGLGLATVHGIVHQSGGHIWVYSEVGRGTTFKIYLPRVDEEAISPSSAKPPVRRLNGSETLLLVEDEELVRKAARRMLESHGYDVLVASCGAEALELARTHAGKIHLVLTDIVMPGMSASELTPELLALLPDVKIIYMSGYSDEAIVHHGVLAPGAAFLQKPFSTESLLEGVRRVLDAPRAR